MSAGPEVHARGFQPPAVLRAAGHVEDVVAGPDGSGGDDPRPVGAEPGPDDVHGRAPAPPVPDTGVPDVGVPDTGVPETFGEPQRAAAGEAQLFRGDGVHAADTVLDHGTFNGLTLRAASVRGTAARYRGGPREDDYAIGHSRDGRWLVLAVADGVSNAQAGHLAATLAVRTAVQQAVRALDEQADAPDVVTDLHGTFQSAAYQIRRAAEPMLAREDRDATPDAIAGLLATTLLLAVVPTALAPPGTPVRIARVGDTAAWLLSGAGWTGLLPGKSEDVDGLASGAVMALPRLPDVLEEVTVEVPRGDLLVLATDGVSDPCGLDMSGEVAEHLRRTWHPRLPSPLAFTRSISFRGQSWDDDRTAVVVAGIGGPAGTPGGPAPPTP